jgi:hypothetical protein
MHVNFALQKKKKNNQVLGSELWKYLNQTESADQRVRKVEKKPGQQCEMENPEIRVRRFSIRDNLLYINGK